MRSLLPLADRGKHLRDYFFFPDCIIDQVAGPVIISALLFFAVLANFILRGALHFVSRWMIFPLNLPDPFVI